MSIRGSIDSLTVEGAAGWIFSSFGNGPVVVQALLFGRIIGEAVADLYRPDLAAVGLGDGHCGFDLTFYDPIDVQHLPMVSVRPQGGDVELPRTNLTGFPDFFRSVQARFPAAGLSRSVFGGLWTDRTDAAQVLSGRIACGATPSDLGKTLRGFIDNGFSVLRSALASADLLAEDIASIDGLATGEPLDPQIEPASRQLLEAVSNILFQSEPLRLFRAILDDNPIAYRTVVRRGPDTAFVQASTAESLPSPAECLLSVIATGEDGVEIDVVRGSHTLPEFTADGRSRWISPDAAAAIDIAIAYGASVDTVQLSARDIAVVGPGTLHRVRAHGTSLAVCTWSTPSRQTPLRLLMRNEGRFQVHHESGARLIV